MSRGGVSITWFSDKNNFGQGGMPSQFWLLSIYAPSNIEIGVQDFVGEISRIWCLWNRFEKAWTGFWFFVTPFYLIWSKILGSPWNYGCQGAIFETFGPIIINFVAGNAIKGVSGSFWHFSCYPLLIVEKTCLRAQICWPIQNIIICVFAVILTPITSLRYPHPKNRGWARGSLPV